MTRLFSLVASVLFLALFLGCGGVGKSGGTLAVNPGDPPTKTGLPAGQTGGKEGGLESKSPDVTAKAEGPLDFSRPIHLLGHQAAVIVGLAYSSDGRHLASISENGELILWSLAKRSGKILTPGGAYKKDENRNLTRYGEHLLFSPDGKTLFSGTASTVTLWDVESGTGAHTFSDTKVEGNTDGMVVAADGKTLVTYGGDGAGTGGWKVWDVAKREPIFKVAYPENDAHWRYSPDSKTLVLRPPPPRRGDRIIHVYDLEKQRELQPIKDDAADLFFIDNDSLGVWSSDVGQAKYSVWHLGDRSGPATLKSRDDFQGDFDQSKTSWNGDRLLSPDRKTLLGYVKGSLPLLNLCDFSTRKFRGLLKAKMPVVFTPDSRTIVAPVFDASGSQGVTLVEADAETGKTRDVLEIPFPAAKQNTNPDLVLAISPAQPGTITVGLPDGSIVIHPLLGKSPGLKELASLPLIPMAGYGNRATTADLRRAEQGRPYALEFSHDGRYLALLGIENLLWDVSSKKLLLTANRAPRSAPTPTFAKAPWPTVMVVPDQDLVLSANPDETVCRYTLSTGALKTRQDGKDTICYASFRLAPDGKTAAALIADEKARRYPNRTYKLALVDPATLKIQTELATFEATGNTPAGDFTFSADGVWLALSTGRDVRLWNLSSRQEKPTTATGGGFGAERRRPTFLGDKTLVVLGTFTSFQMTFYDLASGQSVHGANPHRRHNAQVTNLAVSPASPVCASVNDDGEVLLHDLKTSGLRVRQRAHDDRAYVVAMSPDGKLLATAGADGKLKLWEVSDIPPERTFGTPQLIKPDDEPRDEPGRLKVTELAAFDAKQDPDDKTGAAIALAPDGKRVAAVSLEGSGAIVRFWDPATRKEIDTWEEVGDSSFRFTPDGRWLVGDSLHSFDATTGKPEPFPDDYFSSVTFNCMALAPAGKMVAVGLKGPDDVKEKLLRFLDFPTLKERRMALDAFGSINTLLYSGDGKQLAALVQHKDEHRLLLLDPASGAIRATIAKWGFDEQPPTHFAFSSDGQVLAGADVLFRPNESRLTWWDLSADKPKQLRSVPLGAGSFGLAFIAGGRALAVQLDDHETAVYDVATGTLRSKSQLGLEPLERSAALCPRRGLLISGRENGEILFWDLVSGRRAKLPDGQVAKIEAHRGSVVGLAISADERFLATAGKDNKVKVWSLGK